MAKSNARKKREKYLRTTGIDITQFRSSQPDFDTFVRKSKTKKETLIKTYTKHKKRSLQEKEIPFSKDRFICIV